MAQNSSRNADNTLLPGSETNKQRKNTMNKATLLAMGISAVIAITVTPVMAQEGKDKAPAKEEGGHSHFTKIPATVDGIWKEIQKQQGKLKSVVAKKDLGEAHDHAFAIRDLVKALPGKLASENKAKAEAGAKEITKIATDIDKSSAAKAQKATEANVKKMDAAIAALQKNLKAK
jgi:hypothetical protein